MGEYYNSDGVVVQSGPPVTKEYGHAGSFLGVAKLKVDSKNFPRDMMTGTTGGQEPNETFVRFPGNGVPVRIVVRADRATSNTGAGTIDVTRLGWDKGLAAWGSSSTINVNPISPTDFGADGDTVIENVNPLSDKDVLIGPDGNPLQEYYLAISGDLENWTDFKGTIFVMYVQG